MTWRARIAVGLGLALVAVPCTAVAVRRGLVLGGPHVVVRSRAAIDAALGRRLDAAIDAARVQSVDAAVQLALRLTDEQLHFGLEHKTSLRFGAAEREGHCVEYAHLYAAIFERIAARAHLDAAAYAVHSSTARVLGLPLPGRAFKDHDWSLVVERETGALSYVDASFADLGLGWDVRKNVVGEVAVPK